MPLYTKAYIIQPTAQFADYGKYFHDAIADILQVRDYARWVSLKYNSFLNPPRTVLTSENPDVMWFAERTIASEIRPTPFTFALAVPGALLYAAGQAEAAGSIPAFRLQDGHDYKITGDEYEEDPMVFLFHRASHRQQLIDRIKVRCTAFDWGHDSATPQDIEPPARPAETDLSDAGDNGTISFAAARERLRPEQTGPT